MASGDVADLALSFRCPPSIAACFSLSPICATRASSSFEIFRSSGSAFLPRIVLPYHPGGTAGG
jgi:hypothetical protein